MNVLLLLAHPRSGSFNHALAHAAREQLEADGHRVVFHDLHAERFDPVIPPDESARAAVLPPAVAAHCTDLAAAEGVVVVHPPAVLKGWIDRVVRPGVAYEFLAGDSGEGVPRGLLKARTAVVLNTSNTAPEREQAVFGDPLDTLWRNCVFGLCGVEDVRRRTFGVVVASTAEQRRHWLAEARALVSGAFANR